MLDGHSDTYDGEKESFHCIAEVNLPEIKHFSIKDMIYDYYNYKEEKGN